MMLVNEWFRLDHVICLGIPRMSHPDRANHTEAHTKLRTPPKVTEEDSGVGASLSPSACLPEPFQFLSSIRFFDTVEKVCTSGENFNWERHDLQFNIPTNALPKKTGVTVSFGASVWGNFRLPPSMKLVSAVFLVDVTPSSCFLEDVELKIPHCLELSVELCDRVSFIHAPFNKICRTEVFNFKKLSGGAFRPDLEHGSIWTRDFCLMAIAVDTSHRSTGVTPLSALTLSDLPKTPVQLLPQQPIIHPCFKTIAYFCIPANRTEAVWDVYVMISLKIPSMTQLIMKQLQENNKLPEPIKIDSQNIKFSSRIYVDIADISDSSWTVCTRTPNQVAMEDVADFECNTDYPPHIILEVECSETEMVPRFPGCGLTIRDSTSNGQIGYYRLPSNPGSRSNSCKEKKTIEMADLLLKVVPLVASKWECVGYALGFDVEQIDIIKSDHKEVEKRCEELFHRWLRGDRGKHPKTWSVLLETLSEIPELTAAKEKLENEINNKTQK